MKNIFKIFSLAAIGLAALACTPEELAHQPGEPEVDGCYSVFFPAQEASGSHTFDPTMERKVTVSVSRKVAKGDITVPFSVVSETPDAFKVSDIAFKDGQSETTATISFPDIKSSVTYKMSMVISDPEYASKYNTGATCFDFAVTCVEWNTFVGEGAAAGENKGVLTEFAMDDPYEVEMQYYETSFTDIRFCKLIRGGEDPDYEFYWNTKTNNLYVPAQYLFTLSSGTEFWYGDAADFYRKHNSWESDVELPSDYYFDWAPKWMAKNSFLQPYYDGNGGFYLADFFFGCKDGVSTGSGWQFGADDESGMDIFVAAGFVRTDYSIDAKAGLTSEGVVPVAFEVGDDVEKIRFAVLEGTPSTAEMNNTTEALLAGTFEDAKEIKAVHDDPATEDVEYTVTGISMEKTGVYTLVAASVDAKGNGHETVNLQFTYLVAGDDEETVVVNAGLELTERYAGEGYDKVNSMLYYVYGKDLTEVAYGLYTTATIQNNGIAAVVAHARANSTADAEELELINGVGSSDLFTNLSPLTSYTLVVYASNGYANTVITRTLETEGLPLEKVASGKYVYNGYWEGYDIYDMFIDPNVTVYDSYVLTNWGGGTDFTFAHDPESGAVEVAIQPTGATNNNYGPVYVGEAKNVYSEDYADYVKLPDSYYDEETKTYHFCVAYFVSAGVFNFSPCIETFEVGGTAPDPEAAPAGRLSASKITTSAISSSAARAAEAGINKAGLEVAREAKSVKAEVKSVGTSTKSAKKDFDKMISLGK